MKLRDRMKVHCSMPHGIGVFVWWCKVRGIADPKVLSDDDLERTWAKFQIEMSDAEREALEPKLENPAVGDPWATGVFAPSMWSQELINTFYANSLVKLYGCEHPQTLQKKKPGV